MTEPKYKIGIKFEPKKINPEYIEAIYNAFGLREVQTPQPREGIIRVSGNQKKAMNLIERLMNEPNIHFTIETLAKLSLKSKYYFAVHFREN